MVEKSKETNANEELKAIHKKQAFTMLPLSDLQSGLLIHTFRGHALDGYSFQLLTCTINRGKYSL